MSSAPTDEELWLSTKNGSHPAFARIVENYSTKLYGFIKKRITSEEDAKDILQELLISIWNKREDIELKATLSSYLHGAAKYAVIDWQIKNKKMLGRVELLLDDTVLQNQAHSVERDLIAAELREEILELTDRLPQTVRTVFRMSRVDQKTNSEIAEELQLSDKTVRNNLSLALNFLRKHMGSDLGTLTVCLLIDRVFRK